MACPPKPDEEAPPIGAILLILSAAGGFADAGSFVLIGSFTGHVTGNALLSAVYLVKGKFAAALLSATAVAAFMSGTAAGTAWKHHGATPAERLMMPLMAETVLVSTGLVLFGLGGFLGKILLAAPVCFSLGLQNGTLNKLGLVSVHSTYITGMATSLVSAIFNDEEKARSVLRRVIACFLIGALAGAFLANRFGEPGIPLVLAPLALALGLTALSRRRGANVVAPVQRPLAGSTALAEKGCDRPQPDIRSGGSPRRDGQDVTG